MAEVSKKKNFYHEPTRTTTRYVQKVRGVRVVRGKIQISWTTYLIIV